MKILRKMLAAVAMSICAATVYAGLANIDVYVKDQNGNPVSGVEMVCAKIDPLSVTGDPKQIDFAPGDANGYKRFIEDAGYDYLVFISKNGYEPSFFQQMNNPGIQPVRLQTTGETITLNITIWQVSSPTSMGQLKFDIINISSATVPNKTTIVADIRNKDTDAQIAFGFSQVNVWTTSTTATIYVNNVPVASSATYRAYCGVIQEVNKLGMDSIVYKPVAGGAVTQWDFNFANAGVVSNVQQEAPQTGSTQGQPVFTGVVTSTSNVPLQGAIIELLRHNDTRPDGDFGWAQRTNQTYTDNGGNFAFYNVGIGTYAISVNKQGYLGYWVQDFNPPYGGNSFGYYYNGSNPKMLSQPLQLMKGRGRMKGRILVWDEQTNSTAPVANAYVNVNSFWDNWNLIPPGPQSYDNYYTTGPGKGGNGWGSTRTGGDGIFYLDGLGSGNFDLYVHSEMTGGSEYRFSNGGNRTYDYSGNGRANDDRRIQITNETNVINSADIYSTKVYSSSGGVVLVNYSSETASLNALIDVIIATIPARTGSISGTITFKDYEKYANRQTIPSDNAITLMAWQDNKNWSDGRKVFGWNYSGAVQQTNYSISVETGTAYWVQFKADKWAILNQQDMKCDFTAAGVTNITGKNLTLVPAGAIKVIIKDPYGNIIKRTQMGNQPPSDFIYTSGKIYASGPTQWSNELSEQGETMINSLAPGTYKVSVQIYKYYENNGDHRELPPDYPRMDVENVVVAVDKETVVEIKMKPGTLSVPGGSASALPPLPNGAKGMYAAGGWIHGETLTAEKLAETMFAKMMSGPEGGASETMSVGFGYNSSESRWETQRVPDNKYDFYLGYMNQFNPPNSNSYMPVNYRLSFTVLTTKLSDEIKYDALNPNTTHFIEFGTGDAGTGTLGTCIITGKVKAAKAFPRLVAEKISSGGFSIFFKYIPTVVIYDNQGVFKGFTAAMPTEARMPAWDPIVNSGVSADTIHNFFQSEMASYPLEYWCEKLPAGDYILVVNHPVYPPVMKKVTLVSGTNTLDIDLDDSKISGYEISGVVKSTDGFNIMGANVTVMNKNANLSKKAVTDASGAFTVTGLPPGVYRIEAIRGGYARSGTKVSLTKENASASILMKYADASISGTVFTQRMPAKILPEAKIIIYDETENGIAAVKYLPSYKVITDNNGQYYVPDIIAGHVYKVYCVAEGKYLEYRELTPVAGENTGVDFTVKPSKPRLRISSKKSLVNNQILYNFLIECPNRLINPNNPSAVGAPYCRYSPVATVNSAFDESKAVEVLVIPGTNNTYEIAFNPGTGSNYYKMRILATDGANEFYEDVMFGPNIEARAKKDMAGEIAEGGQIDIDSTGYDSTKIGLDPGSVTPASVTQTTVKTGAAEVPVGGFLSALPNFQLSKTGNAKSDAMEKLVKSIVASDVYDIDLDGAQLNKSVTLTFNYSRDSVGEDELNQLQIGRYNTNTGKWEIVPGIVTADPLTSSVSLDVESIGGTNINPAPKAKWDGRKFSINKAASNNQSGVYAVFLQDPNSIKQYAGDEFVIFNFPNPFDLKSKTVDTQDDYSTDKYAVTGTMIKYAMPAKYTGEIKFYIYNIAGEMVRELDLGTKSGGYYYYAEWDGRNDNGEDCASGVYLLIAKCEGKKMNDKVLKMALIK